MRGSRTAALLSGLTAVAAVALTACGVPPSGVIETGAPASGMFSPSATPPSTPATIPLFFLRDGELTPYPRRIDDAGDLEAVVRLLFEGPTANEAAMATTELPRLTDAPRMAIDGGILFVKLPGETAPLSRRAMLQLTCTVNHAASPVPTAVPRADAEADGDTARRSAAPSSLHVFGDGWAMTQSDHACPVVSPPQEQPEAPTPWGPSG
ncbi:GerMN domain-containing protein [Streptomyces viridosporus]|uniref:GerMN domain-containing protein n=1 Tax=Streptomyces viridosporus TaxID=67581 RepID=UPI0009C15FA1|nr:GerMN domain-containing protein [Streptomyces viridosporus]